MNWKIAFAWFLSLSLILSINALGQSIAGKIGGTTPPTNRPTLAIAKDYLKYEAYQDALPYVDQLLASKPKDATYNFWMAKCLFYSYKKNMALAYFEKVNKLDAEVDEEFHYYYGLTLQYNYDFAKAKNQFEFALELFRPDDPAYAEIQKRIAQCDYGQKQMDYKHPDSDRITLKNTGSNINSKYAEHSPIISANDSVLLYTARRPECLGANLAEHYYDEDLYISFKRGDVWGKGVNMGKPINSEGHDATISLTADGRTLYIYRTKENGGLFVADFDTVGKQWSKPRAVEAPLNSKYYEACICVSADGSKLFFSSDRPGGFGGRDLYMVRKNDNGKWGEPINLGEAVNTQWNDDAPFFHPNGKTLYFSSDGPQSMGGWDIFVTEYLEDQDRWLAPINMGYPVNTPDDDIYFVSTADGLTGYASSGKEGGYGEKDIYTIDFPYFPYPRREFNVQLAGFVIDEGSNDTITGTVRLVDQTNSEILVSAFSNPRSKQFHVTLKPEHQYAIEVVADGYPLYTEALTAPKLTGKDIRIDKTISLQKRPEIVTVEGEKFPEIMHVYYDYDKYDLRKESYTELDAVVKVLLKNKDLKLQLHGHTDWFNTVEYNIALSRSRCHSPMAYLIDQGIDPARIEVKNFSENKPLDTNENDTGRQFNRRAEFHFLRGEEVVYSSTKLRDGREVRVDHAIPNGAPGFDHPEMVEFLAQGSQPESFPEKIQQKDVTPNWASNNKHFRINLTVVDWK